MEPKNLKLEQSIEIQGLTAFFKCGVPGMQDKKNEGLDVKFKGPCSHDNTILSV